MNRRSRSALSPDERLLAKFDKDPRVQSFRTIVGVDKKLDLPLETWRGESRTLHRTRTVSKLTPSSAKLGRNIISAVVTENAARSRMTEMLVEASRVNRLYLRYLDALTDYLSVEYGTELSALCKTIKERERFVTVYLEDYISYRQDVEDFITELQYYITDIDKAGYGIKAMSEVFTAVFRAEGRVDRV